MGGVVGGGILGLCIVLVWRRRRRSEFAGRHAPTLPVGPATHIPITKRDSDSSGSSPQSRGPLRPHSNAFSALGTGASASEVSPRQIHSLGFDSAPVAGPEGNVPVYHMVAPFRPAVPLTAQTEREENENNHGIRLVEGRIRAAFQRL